MIELEDFDNSETDTKEFILKHAKSVMKSLGIDYSSLKIEIDDDHKIIVQCDNERLCNLFKNILLTTTTRLQYLDEEDLDAEEEFGCKSFMTH